MNNDVRIDKEKLEKPSDFLPGAGIDIADNEKVDEKFVDERTKTQNDNPRDHDLF